MSEYENALVLARRILDRPNEDPDGDLAMLARQFLRAVERAAAVRIIEPLPDGRVLWCRVNAPLDPAMRARIEQWFKDVIPERRIIVTGMDVTITPIAEADKET